MSPKLGDTTNNDIDKLLAIHQTTQMILLHIDTFLSIHYLRSKIVRITNNWIPLSGYTTL